MTLHQTTTPHISPTSLFQLSHSFPPIPNLVDNNDTAFIIQAKYIIKKFSGASELNLTYNGIMNESYADLYEFSSGNSSYWVNNVTGRVQSALWYETGSKSQKEIIDLDQGYTIAEYFAQEKYPEFWKTSDIRSTKLLTKNVLDRGEDRQLQYEWWEIYYTPDKNTLPHSEIPGFASVSVTVSPYTSHVIEYFEIYTPFVTTGESPVDLTPTFTEGKAKKIAEDYFTALVVPETRLTGPEALGLRILNDNGNNPHLTWNFEMIKTQTIGEKNQQFEFNEYAFVSIDAHDGTIIRSAPFG